MEQRRIPTPMSSGAATQELARRVNDLELAFRGPVDLSPLDGAVFAGGCAASSS